MLNNKLPNLLIVGAAKSGTTSLHHYLNQHPDVFMSSHKEPHFLINSEIGNNRIPNGISDFAKYKMLFNDGQVQKYRGESSVMYLSFPEIVIPNIKFFLGEDVKIIIMLRNPIDRAFSGYQHVKRYNKMENYTFKEAIEKSEKRYFENNNITPASRYLHIGLYYKFVHKFKSKFKDNVHIIIYDDFINKTSYELSCLFDFLGLKKYIIDLKKKHMVGGWQWKNESVKDVFMSKSILKYHNRFFKVKLNFPPFFQKRIFRKVTLFKFNVIPVSKKPSKTVKTN